MKLAVILSVALLLSAVFNLRYLSVAGTSMSPTLESGHNILVDRLQYRFRSPRPGDVVVVKLHPEDWFFSSVGSGQYVKRVVAGPGDTIQIIGGQVYVNGSPLAEPYLTEPSTPDIAPVNVPTGHYFLLGDNRNQTNDSRDWGPLPRNRITGKMLFSF